MLDTSTQRKAMYKEIHLEGIPYHIMTGDSISNTFATVTNLSNYLYRVDAESYLQNKAIGGTSIANRPDPDGGFNALSFVTRSDSQEANSFVIDNTDVLLVWASYNDWANEVPLGTLASNDPAEFSGAINIGVANYLARNPECQLIFITPNNNPFTANNSIGLTLNDYRNQMITVCANLGIPCFDLYPEEVCGITDANKAEALPDETHPTATFLQMWSPLFAEFVNDNT